MGVVGGVVVGGGSSLWEYNLAAYFMRTVLRLHKFLTGRDPQLNRFLLDFGSTNSLRDGIQLF